MRDWSAIPNVDLDTFGIFFIQTELQAPMPRIRAMFIVATDGIVDWILSFRISLRQILFPLSDDEVFLR